MSYPARAEGLVNSISLFNILSRTRVEGILLPSRDEAGLFNGHSRLSCYNFWPTGNFLIVNVLWTITPSPFAQQMFLVGLVVLWPKSNLENISIRLRRCLFMHVCSKRTQTKTLQNVSAQQQPRYYRPELWTASVTWYICCKLACIKILQHF